MGLPPLRLTTALVVLPLLASLGGSPRAGATPSNQRPTTSTSEARGGRAAGGPELFYVASPWGEAATASEIGVAQPGPDGLRRAQWGAVTHGPGAVVRGIVVPTEGPRRVAVVAASGSVSAQGSDFDAALHVLENGLELPLSVEGLVRGSRPLAWPDGSLIVEGGNVGEVPDSVRAARGALREDHLFVDAVSGVDGRRRRLVEARGYALHVAGVMGRRVVVERIDDAGAALLLVDVTGSEPPRVITLLPPFARDFSGDGASLVFVNRDADERAIWAVQRATLVGGRMETSTLTRQRGDAPAPFLLADGLLARTAPNRLGLVIGSERLSFGGDAFDAVVAANDDGTWMAVDHLPADPRAEEIFLVQRPRGAALPLRATGSRVEVLGFADAPGRVVR